MTTLVRATPVQSTCVLLLVTTTAWEALLRGARPALAMLPLDTVHTDTPGELAK